MHVIRPRKGWSRVGSSWTHRSLCRYLLGFHRSSGRVIDACLESKLNYPERELHDMEMTNTMNIIPQDTPQLPLISSSCVESLQRHE